MRLRLRAFMGAEGTANILIVDDRPEQLLAMQVVLADLPANIVRAESGKEALRQLLHQEFAVILLDVKMPIMDGFETAALIRQRPACQDTPIIFVTAYDLEDLARSYALGAVDYIQTPIVPEILRTKVGVFVDLFTKAQKIKQQAQQLQEHVQELTELNRELEAFSYSISHDMRAPLRSMQGFAQHLIDEYNGKLDEHAVSRLQRICRSAIRLDNLIQDVLSYQKILRAEAPKDQVDLDRLVRDMIQTYPDWQPPKAHIQIENALPSVIGNEAFLTQCVSSLVGNAIKFVPPGALPEIKIGSELIGSQVRVSFQDNGIGIAPEDQSRIFRLFERVSPATQYEGTGIGLTIVRKAVQRMGGQVGLQSEPGKGSRFWIQLEKAD